jgi:ADP-ribose pyrophosphatase YjhB (NUDIX family)
MITTIDTVAFRYSAASDAIQVLTVRRAKPPFEGELALPGGFVFEDQDETLDDTVERVIKTKTNHQLVYYEQVCTHGSAHRDPRGWSVTVVYLCLFSGHATENKPDIQWLDLDKLLDGSQRLPFDHNQLVKKAYHRLQSKAMYSTLPGFLLPEYFSLSEYQHVAEKVIGAKLNQRGVRFRLEESHAIEDANMTRETGKRPARLFRLSQKDKPQLFDRMMYGKSKG